MADKVCEYCGHVVSEVQRFRVFQGRAFHVSCALVASSDAHAVYAEFPDQPPWLRSDAARNWVYVTQALGEMPYGVNRGLEHDAWDVA